MTCSFSCIALFSLGFRKKINQTQSNYVVHTIYYSVVISADTLGFFNQQSF